MRVSNEDMEVSNDNIGALQWKYGVSNENFAISNDNMGVLNENVVFPMKIWGSPKKKYGGL